MPFFIPGVPDRSAVPEIFHTQTKKNHRMTAPKKQNHPQFTACGKVKISGV